MALGLIRIRLITLSTNSVSSDHLMTSDFRLFFAIFRVPDDRLLVQLPYVTDAETAIHAVKRYSMRGLCSAGYVVRHSFQRNRLAGAKVVRIDPTISTAADLDRAPHNSFLTEP